MLDTILSRHATPATRLLRASKSLRESFVKACAIVSSFEGAPRGQIASAVMRDLGAFYGVDVAPLPTTPSTVSWEPPEVVPALKHLSPESLESLCELSFGSPTPVLAEWSAALLRGSELNQGRLIPRLRNLWGVRAGEALGATLLMATVLENFGAATRDLRYLNATLKIVDELSAQPLHRGHVETWNDLLLLRLSLRLRSQIENEVSA